MKHDTALHVAAGGFGLNVEGCPYCDYVRAEVAKAPPLTDEQIARVARLLTPYAGTERTWEEDTSQGSETGSDDGSPSS